MNFETIFNLRKAASDLCLDLFLNEPWNPNASHIKRKMWCLGEEIHIQQNKFMAKQIKKDPKSNEKYSINSYEVWKRTMYNRWQKDIKSGNLEYQTPRSCDINQATPAENAIRNAMAEVEKLEPNELLTDAVLFLQNALNKVSYFVDNKIQNDG